MSKHLLLNLEGPMQAWGLACRFDIRSTYVYPTKSGIIGLICAALGDFRPNRKRLAQLSKLSMTAYRVKEGTLMEDFHTIGGGYDSVTEREFIVRSAKGRYRTEHGRGEAVITKRRYLCGARYIVDLSGDDALIAECGKALENPRATLFLGRKACLPTAPVFAGVVTEKALKGALKCQGVDKGMRFLTDAAAFTKGDDTLLDVPVDFSTREFAIRRVSENVY